MYYAGIGSRQTPAHILTIMTAVARVLQQKGWILRSGGADGADSAFEIGAGPTAKEIHLPWPGYNGRKSQFTGPSQAAIDMASGYHPAWERCSQGAHKLHGRNCNILLGKLLDTPVSFVICWTPKAAVTGGTGMGLRLATDRTIEIFNLANPEHLARITDWIEESNGSHT